MTARAPGAPRQLSDRSRKLWGSVLARHRLEDEHLVTLELTLSALDRADAARDQLAEDGLTVKGAHGGMAAHPAVAIERDARIFVLRGMRQLGLDLFADEVSQSRAPDGRFA